MYYPHVKQEGANTMPRGAGGNYSVMRIRNISLKNGGGGAAEIYLCIE